MAIKEPLNVTKRELYEAYKTINMLYGPYCRLTFEATVS